MRISLSYVLMGYQYVGKNAPHLMYFRTKVPFLYVHNLTLHTDLDVFRFYTSLKVSAYMSLDLSIFCSMNTH